MCWFIHRLQTSDYTTEHLAPRGGWTRRGRLRSARLVIRPDEGGDRFSQFVTVRIPPLHSEICHLLPVESAALTAATLNM